MLNGYTFQYWQRCNAFADGRITQYIYQMAFNYIVVPQQKWNNTYLETTFKLDMDIALWICLQSVKLTTTIKS